MKKWTKGLLGVLVTGAVLIAGCSPIPSVKNEKTGIIFNGGATVSVGNNLFYGNGFVSGVDDFSTSSDNEYNKAKAYTYLARTDLSEFKGEKNKNDSTVYKLSDRVVGYGNEYMFVCGNYIYFVTPNIHKTKENKYVWNYLTVMRCDLNGGSQKELYTTTSYSASSAQLKALSYDGKDYFIVYDGTNLLKFTLGNNVSVDVLTDCATSVALPAEGENWNGKIYYTENRTTTAGQSGNKVYEVNVKTNENKKLCEENGLTVSFTGRVENTLLYTVSSETYSVDMDKLNGRSFVSVVQSDLIYPGEISNVKAIANDNDLFKGYVFSTKNSSSAKLMYYNTFKAETMGNLYEAEVFIEQSQEFTSTVTIYGSDLYYATSDAILRKSVTQINSESEEIVKGMSFKTGYFGYDYSYDQGIATRLNNIYFYAQIDVEEDNSEDKDENYYLFAVSATPNSEPKLVGKKA